MAERRKPRDIFSTHDAARICSVTPMTVIRWIKEGKIPAFRTAGGHRRSQRPDLDRFCRDRGIPFAPDRESAPGRILVAATDLATRGVVAEAARAVDEQLTIETTADAFGAGRLVCSFRPDLLFLDQRLPGLEAQETCASLAHDPATASIRVVVLSPTPTPDGERALRSRGALAVLRWPPDAADIGRLVRSVFHIPDDDAPGRLRSTALLVDHDLRHGQRLADALRAEAPGCQVDICDSCLEALLRVGAEPPALLLLDLELGEEMCLEVIRRVGRLRARPPVVLATAPETDDELRARVLLAGGRDLLPRPATVAQVLAHLASPEVSQPRVQARRRQSR